jgi:hypothetical protein
MEFPEVFYGPCTGSERTSERLEGAGFDAVVGNPPYDVLSNEELGGDAPAHSDDALFVAPLGNQSGAMIGGRYC